MASLPDSARAVLQSPAMAHLVTLNPDGSPQVNVVWVGLDGDEIVAAIGSAGASRSSEVVAAELVTLVPTARDLRLRNRPAAGLT